ncbi:hypothetical protein LJC11_03910 [Bacteroidales bacterium OttesenSCG-928-I21]|nr:hypothetical protein [Bacteroidales bacterium OttesenSCG-928-I21]
MKTTFPILLLLFILSSCNTIPPDPHYIPENIELKNGDIAFRKGNSAESYAVTAFDSEAVYSHVGVVIDINENWFIVHAVPGEAEPRAKDTIKMDSIHIFFRKDRAQSGAIYRLNISDSLTKIIAKNTLEYYNKKVLFDNYFNLEDTTMLYCTELVHSVYKSAGINITENRRHKIPGFPSPIIWPSDILKNKNLIEIYNY